MPLTVDPNSKTQQILTYFRDSVASKVDKPQEAYEHLRNKFGVTKQLVSNLRPRLQAIMDEKLGSTKMTAPATNGHRKRGGPNTGERDRVLAYFKKNWAGKLDNVQECYKDVQQALSCPMNAIYTSKARMEQLNAEAKAIANKQTTGPVEDQEQDEEEGLGLEIPADLSEQSREIFLKLINSYVSVTQELLIKEQELEARNREMIMASKKLNLTKGIIGDLVDAL